MLVLFWRLFLNRTHMLVSKWWKSESSFSGTGTHSVFLRSFLPTRERDIRQNCSCCRVSKQVKMCYSRERWCSGVVDDQRHSSACANEPAALPCPSLHSFGWSVLVCTRLVVARCLACATVYSCWQPRQTARCSSCRCQLADKNGRNSSEMQKTKSRVNSLTNGLVDFKLVRKPMTPRLSS